MKPRSYGPFPYSPIIDRPKLEWPGGAHVALWIIPNIEYFSMMESPGGYGAGAKIPNVPMWSERDYGNRVGVFRIMDALDKYGIRGTVALNSNLCAEHPRIMEEGEKRKIVKNTFTTIAKATGKPVKGWLSSGLQETWESLDHLVDNGCQYVADWCNDDQPYQMTLDDGRTIVSMPYTQQLNDKSTIEHRYVSADGFKQMICDQFDVLYKEGAKSGRVMAIAVHPYLIGVPHRIGAFDAALKYICKHKKVWKATGSEIAGHYFAQLEANAAQHDTPSKRRAERRAVGKAGARR